MGRIPVRMGLTAVPLVHLFLLTLFTADSRPPSLANGGTTQLTDCETLDSLFLSVHQSDEDHPNPACRCYVSGSPVTSIQLPSTTREGEQRALERTAEQEHLRPSDVWIGCTGQSMPAVYRALHSLNGTTIPHLMIWDSSISILPSDMFSQIRPTSLVIESSAASVVRNGTFSRIGPHLRHLRLNKNILKRVDSTTFAGLDQLVSLDLSENKIASLQEPSIFEALSRMESLNLANNHITHIADGVFEKLASLKHLDLSGNQLTNVSKRIFAGLHNLETLSLQGNKLGSLEAETFAGLKNLRVVDLGGNRLEYLSLSHLPALSRLRMNDNHVAELKSVELIDTPKLESIHLDHNELERLSGDDLLWMADCNCQLTSLSLANNYIASIDHDAFKLVPTLRLLSLQQNALESLTGERDGVGNDTGVPQPSWLQPLTELRRLHLSHNRLKEIRSGDLAGLSKLQVLALDHNRLELVEAGAFDGLTAVHRVFLDSNRLYYLPKGLFNSLHVGGLQVLDLSNNPWECICGQEWLGEWLRTVVEPSVALEAARGDMGCLAVPMKECKDGDGPHSTKHTDVPTPSTRGMVVLAVLFSLATIISMLTIGYLLVTESCGEGLLLNRLRRVPSDTVYLLPDDEIWDEKSTPKVALAAASRTRPPLIYRYQQSKKEGGGGRDLRKAAAPLVLNAPLLGSDDGMDKPANRSQTGTNAHKNSNKKAVHFDDEVR